MTAPTNGGSILERATSIGMFLLLVGGAFWTLAYAPINAELSDLRSQLREIQKQYLTLAEHQQYKQAIERDIARIDGSILKINEAVVSRGELSQIWAANTNSFNAQQRQIDEIKRDLGSTYTANDKLKEIQKRLDDIQGRMFPAK